MWSEPLKIAWWNVGLAPKKGRAARAECDDVEELAGIANGVVLDLYEQGVSIIALCEVLPATLGRIAADTKFEIAADEYMDVDAGIGVLFDPSKVLVEFDANVDSSLRNRDVTRAIAFTIRVASEPIVDLIAVHWPARTVSEGAALRASLGSGLQTHITNLIDLGGDESFVVVCGDFNDDPFDASLTANLFGTRDRGLARRQPRALYNPFWRLLGERRAHDNEPAHAGAGTCFWRSGTHTRWHTFDQFLFSSSFLDDGAWQLVESATEIWDREPLADIGGTPSGNFDHYPVVTGIRARAVGEAGAAE